MRKLLRFPPVFKYSILPLLGILYPPLFYYANNARLVLFSSLLEICFFLSAVAIALYIVLVVASRRKFPQAAIGALLIIVFFYTYGFAMDWLKSIDLFQVETYNFLPFWIFAAWYGAWMITSLRRDRADQVWNILTIVSGALITFNLFMILPVEIDKYQEGTILSHDSTPVQSTAVVDQGHPDIYYIIFDEGAAFEVARRYWRYNGVDEFVDFLKAQGFYVAEQSHSGSLITMREIASRLNYEDLPINRDDVGIYTQPIADNRVMKYLKNLGYTTVVYQEPQYILPTEFPRLPADYLFEKPDTSIDNGIGFMDDFKRLVLDNTALRPLVINITPGLKAHKDFILYTSSQITKEAVPSPKFVYVHLLLPHAPFIFDANGGITHQTTHYNWQAYFGTYQYSIKVAKQMIESILSSADPARPPVIIFQSDHGARNLINPPFSGFLENYPDEYKSWIINTMYLPGCKNAPLKQDLDPINTFPIVFNCYFNDHIPLK